MSLPIANIKKENGHIDIVFPENFKISDEKMYVKRLGNSILLIPFDAPWDNFNESLHLFSNDFLEEREQLVNEKRESFE